MREAIFVWQVHEPVQIEGWNSVDVHSSSFNDYPKTQINQGQFWCLGIRIVNLRNVRFGHSLAI